MEEKDLKTTPKQRLIIGLIAFLLLGSTIAVYAMIVLGNDSIDYSRMTLKQLESAYEETFTKYQTRATELSSQYFDEFKEYKSEVKAFNAASVTEVTSRDLKEGDGDTVETGKYSAYYIGYCADETIFDSSLAYDSEEEGAEPTSLRAPLDVDEGTLIEGWYTGVEGMKLDGIRKITIPGELAYGDTSEICGGYNSPLKFIVYAVPRDEQLGELTEQLNKIYSALSAAYASSYSSQSSSQAETSGE